MQIWDTAGQQRFKTITQTYYKGAMGIIMTYSVNDIQSFNAMENWLRQIKTHASENVVKVLIGNKIDCSDRQISYNQGKQLADTFGVEFFQVSAKENKNITDVFMFMGKDIKDKILTGQINNVPNKNARGKQLKQVKKEEQSTCC